MRHLVQIGRRIVLTGGAFLLFFVVGAAFSYGVLPLARLGAASSEHAARRCRRIVARAWVVFHDYMRVCGLLHYDPRAARIALPPGGAVVVANHPTLVDVTALVSACPDLVFVVKRDMFRSPLVGRLLRSCGQIEFAGGVLSGTVVIDEALAHLRRGNSVLMFPEGTRSPEGGIGPFLSGAFEIASRAQVPIVPLFIRCDPPALMRGQRWHEIPERTVRLTVTQLPALAPPPPGAIPRERDALRCVYADMLERRAAVTANDSVVTPPEQQEDEWKSLSVRSSS